MSCYTFKGGLDPETHGTLQREALVFPFLLSPFLLLHIYFFYFIEDPFHRNPSF